MVKIKPRTIIFFFLAFLIGVLLIIKAIPKEPEKPVIIEAPEKEEISEEPEKLEKTLSDPGFLPKKIEEISEKYPLLPYLPLMSEKFDLDYLSPLKLRVILKKGTKEEVLDWIRSKGVDPQTHEIEWLTPGP